MSVPDVMSAPPSPAPSVPPPPEPSTSAPQVVLAAPAPTCEASFKVKNFQGQIPGLATDSEDRVLVPQTKEQYLQKLYETSNPGENKLVVRRIKPTSWEGYKLSLSPLVELDVLPHGALRDAVADWFGGGEFQVLVRGPSNNILTSMQLNIDCVQNPPKIPNNAARTPGVAQADPAGAYAGQVPGMSGAAPGQALAGQDSAEVAEVRRLQLEERRALQAEQTQRAQLRMLRAEKEFRTEQKQEGEESVREAQMIKEELNKQSQAMMQGFKDITGALAQALTAPREDKTAALYMEMLKESREAQQRADERYREAQQEVTRVITTALTARPEKNNSDNDMFKTVLAANQQYMQTVMEASKRDTAPMEKVLGLVIEKRLGADEDKTETFLKGVQFGRDLVSDSGPGEPMIDPKSGFWPNFGNMILSSVGRLFGGLGQAVGNRMAQPPMLTPQFQQHQQMPQLPAPMPEQQPVYLQPAPQMPQPVYQQAAPVQAPAAAQANPNVVHMFYDGVVVEPQVASDPSASQIQPAVVSDASEHVTEAVRMALADIAAGRTEQDWADYALGKWGNFLQMLVQAPDDASRLRLIQQQCAPAVYAQFSAALGANPVGMRNFLNSLRTMLTEYQQNQGPRSAIA